MGRIRKTFIDKIIKEKNIKFNRPKNFYVYVYINVENGEGVFNINNNLERNVVEELVDYINEVEYKNVVLICRSEKEQFSEPFPSISEVKFLKEETNKNVKIFYQEPWPAKVPNFIESDETLFIRFGFDEGCDFDKLCVSSPTFKTKKEDGEYFFLINETNSKLLYE